MNQGAVIAYLSGIVSYNSKVREVERNLIVHFRPIPDIESWISKVALAYGRGTGSRGRSSRCCPNDLEEVPVGW